MIAIGDVSRTLADEAYSRIREAMHSGLLKPGHKLRFSELQELTDTSVTPVREALARLTAEGFTELEGHRGYRVAPVSSTDLWDIVRNRQRLESEALASVDRARRRSLGSPAHHSSPSAGPDGPRARRFPTAVDEQWEPRHQAFHEALIAACQSKVLLGFCSQLYARANRYRRLSDHGPGRSARHPHRAPADFRGRDQARCHHRDRLAEGSFRANRADGRGNPAQQVVKPEDRRDRTPQSKPATMNTSIRPARRGR